MYFPVSLACLLCLPVEERRQVKRGSVPENSKPLSLEEPSLASPSCFGSAVQRPRGKLTVASTRRKPVTARNPVFLVSMRIQFGNNRSGLLPQCLKGLSSKRHPKDEELGMMEGLGRTLVSTEVPTGAIGSKALSESAFAQMEKV